MSLEREIQQFKIHLSDLLGPFCENEGKYAVVKGDEINGPYPDYESALKHGYERYGLVSFLVKKIERVESVMFFAREMI